MYEKRVAQRPKHKTRVEVVICLLNVNVRVLVKSQNRIFCSELKRETPTFAATARILSATASTGSQSQYSFSLRLPNRLRAAAVSGQPASAIHEDKYSHGVAPPMGCLASRTQRQLRNVGVTVCIIGQAVLACSCFRFLLIASISATTPSLALEML